MDYIKGRACKMNVWKENTKEGTRFFIGDKWYDHTDSQLHELLKYVDLPIPQKATVKETEHGAACNCDDCRKLQGKKPFDPHKDFHDAMKPGNIKITSFKI